MHTGDLAVIDAEGYCNIVGRIKDMVIRGGENIYPREIEEFLYRASEDSASPGLRRPDEVRRRAVAWMQLPTGETLTAEEIREFCRGQIAHHKMPR